MDTNFAGCSILIPMDEICANCGKRYEEHMLFDGYRCAEAGKTTWFPQTVAEMLKEKMKEQEEKDSG
jgi:hypothetical protein